MTVASAPIFAKYVYSSGRATFVVEYADGRRVAVPVINQYPDGTADPEFMIGQAMYAVEAAGASPALTEAVVLLGQARDAYVRHRETRPMTSDENHLIDESWAKLIAVPPSPGSSREGV